jgi:hypothetical protein
MTGWNLPPGCSVRDLPGNSPAEQAAEALGDELYGLLPDAECYDAVFEFVQKAISKAYADGYAQGQSDEAQAREWKRDNENTKND